MGVGALRACGGAGILRLCNEGRVCSLLSCCKPGKVCMLCWVFAGEKPVYIYRHQLLFIQ